MKVLIFKLNNNNKINIIFKIYISLAKGLFKNYI